MKPVQAAEGDLRVRAGEVATEMFILETGCVEILVGDARSPASSLPRGVDHRVTLPAVSRTRLRLLLHPLGHLVLRHSGLQWILHMSTS